MDCLFKGFAMVFVGYFLVIPQLWMCCWQIWVPLVSWLCIPNTASFEAKFWVHGITWCEPWAPLKSATFPSKGTGIVMGMGCPLTSEPSALWCWCLFHILTVIPQCPPHIAWEVRKPGSVSPVRPFLQNCLGILCHLYFHTNFRFCLPVSPKVPVGTIWRLFLKKICINMGSGILLISNHPAHRFSTFSH